MKYRHVVVRRTGGPEVLQIAEDELPAPISGQVLVKILAADVGFSDVNIRRGRYPGGPGRLSLPVTPLSASWSDWALTPRDWRPGRLSRPLPSTGATASTSSCPAQELYPVPAGVDPGEAVTLVFNYLAAYQMLHRVAHVAAGQRILVHGAAGGLGTAFLELGHLAGLEMYGTASKPKHGLVQRLGATPIDYRAEDFVERIATLTEDAGVDAVFDPMGSAHLKRSVRAVHKGGTVVAYGYYEAAQRGSNPILDVLSQYVRLWLWSLPPQRKHVAFYDTRPTKKKHPDWYRDDLARLFALLAAGELRPVIAARLPLEEVVTAHRMLEDKGVQGRLVLTPNAHRTGYSCRGCPRGPIPVVGRVNAGTTRTSGRSTHESVPVVHLRGGGGGAGTPGTPEEMAAFMQRVTTVEAEMEASGTFVLRWRALWSGCGDRRPQD